MRGMCFYDLSQGGAIVNLCMRSNLRPIMM